ncbi:hypothetical protein AX16_006982 [Volvariella volvacea WC 439]|nr:hypothetical protein AX16_006982 [Volvariella volvacea WC 439]
MSSSTLTPYLQLPHILSLTWLAYPILSLILVLFRLQLSLASSQQAVANAKDNLLTSCKAAEQAATAAASMPRYMAIATNKQFADAVNGTMNGARAALILSLTVMEGIINFLIDIYRSTFLCFLELVIRGGLAILIGAVEELNNLVRGVADGLRSTIQDSISGANRAIQEVVDLANRINPFGDIPVPRIEVPNLNGLENVQLPSSFQDSLTRLNETLPTFGDLKDKIEEIISRPFDLVKQEINETFTGLNFDAQTLPVPQQSSVTFCHQMDTSVVDDLGRDLIKIAKIGTVILVALILLLIGLNCLLQWYKWRCLKDHLEYTRQAWMTDPTMIHPKAYIGAPQVTLSDHNLMILYANSSHPLLTRICNTLTARLGLSPTQHTHLQWFFNYIFHSPALAVFLIGFFGLLAVQIQLWALGPLTAHYSDRAASTVSDFSRTITTSINDSMYNQSAAYANDINARVDATQSTINDGVFGWVNQTTSTLNTTINEFYDDIQNAVSTAFGGTILEQPAQEFIRCLIGTKVDAIENALTFMQENLRVDMPRVNDSALVLSQESVDEAARPIALAAIGGGNDDDQGLVGRLINSYADTLKKERIMFGIFMGIWGIVVFMGLCVVLWHSFGRGIVENRRRRRWQKEQRSGINGLVVPFREPPPGPVNFNSGPVQVNFNAAGGNNRANTEVRADEEKNWDGYFGHGRQGQGLAQPISGPMRLMALGRKVVGKDGGRSSSKTQQDAAWYGRIANILSRKPVPTQDVPDQYSNTTKPQRVKPNLTISVEGGSDMDDLPRVVNSSGVSPHHNPVVTSSPQLQSRWSTSPSSLPKRNSLPWLCSVLSPTRRASSPKPRSKNLPNVPTDVGSEMEDPFANLKGSKGPTETTTYFAPPLHHGFDAPPPPPGLTYELPPGYESLNDLGNKRALSPPPRLMSPKFPSPTITLAPPPAGKQKRPGGKGKTVTWGTVTVSPTEGNTAQAMTSTEFSLNPTTEDAEDSKMYGPSVTPVNQFSTTQHARQSSSINPFVTPFDDEHRVSVPTAPVSSSNYYGNGANAGGQQQYSGYSTTGQGQGQRAKRDTDSSFMSNSNAYAGIAV